MKKNLKTGLLVFSLLLASCNDEKTPNQLIVALSADYPPFEYFENGEIKGFDVDLAELIGKELDKKIVFENMQFSTILPALQNNTIDAAISSIEITEERAKNFDFSDSYFKESLAIIYPKNKPISVQSQLENKKIACQLGTTMEIWLKQHVLTAEICALDNSNQAIEALKAGHVEGALLDRTQGATFAQKNPELACTVIAQSDTGYGIAVKKDSPLKEKINAALKTLKKTGALDKLKKKWLGEDR